jgi:hypothetical protein
MDRGSLSTILTRLRSIGADVVVFGGWAEELCGLRQPGFHSDVDLLYFAGGFDPIDRLLDDAPDLIEIQEKRLPHKRAYVYRGIRVELFLVSRDEQGFFTPFWGTKQYRWPSGTHGGLIEGLPVAAPAALAAYRRDHEGLKNAESRQRHRSSNSS